GRRRDSQRTGWRGGFMSLLFRGRIVVSRGSDKVPSAIETGDNQRPEQAGAGAKIFALSLPSPAKT
ncbi:hypothetical protein AB1I66_22520, partial [[Clostridium] symbiosum]